MKKFTTPLIYFSILAALGCNFDLISELEKLPVCNEDWSTDPTCPGTGTSTGETGSPLPTTSGAEEGIVTTAQETAATLPELTTGGPIGSTSGGQSDAAPMILGVELDPDTLQQAAPVAVQVEALNAAEVTMTLDDGEPISLTASGANFFKGSIEVYGASMNGSHIVLITAVNAGLIDTKTADFKVEAPPSGQNIWLRTNDVPHSQTRAIAVDADNNVYEVGTSGKGAGNRLVVSKRDPFGNPVWPGTWLTLHDGDSQGEDIAVGPDGLLYVLGNYQDDNDHTRWWLGKLDPGTGTLVGEPQLGEVDEPARGLSIADNGDLAIVGYATVWGKQKANDVQTKVWFRPLAGLGVIAEWGYSPGKQENKFTEMPEDVLIEDGRIFVVGSVDGTHPDDLDNKQRKRLFVIEINHKGQVARQYIAGNDPYLRSGGYALARDGKGGVVTAGWACQDACKQVGEIQWFKGDGALVPYARHIESSKEGPAYAVDVAYNPAGYHVVASAVSVAPDLNLALRVTGRRPDDLALVFSYTFDTDALEIGQAVAVGLHGYVWFGGLRMLNNVMHAVSGRSYG